MTDTRLTIPYTLEELTHLVSTYAPDHSGLSVTLARQLLAAMQDIEDLKHDVGRALDRNTELMAENERLRTALTFYGEERHYWEEYKDSIFRTTAIAEDRGKKARKALSNEV